jgi:hypothetical protein
MTLNPHNIRRSRTEAKWLNLLESSQRRWDEMDSVGWRAARLDRFTELAGCPRFERGGRSASGARIDIGFPVRDPRTGESALVGQGELVKYCRPNLPAAARLLAACGGNEG